MAVVIKARSGMFGAPRSVSLEDKYDLDESRGSSSRARRRLSRLLLMQKEIDRRAGLHTAGFISGYRGSPLGGLDLTFPARQRRSRRRTTSSFEPGLNEDLAATAIWGAQQAEMRGEGRFDGVFASGTARGRASIAPAMSSAMPISPAPRAIGGVLALMGDDHTAESSTTAHQSEFTFVDVMMPILAPAGVQELIDYGLYGYALSRYSGCWVGLKCLKETIELTASVDAALDRVQPVVPTRFHSAAGRPQHPPARSRARAGKAAAG